MKSINIVFNLAWLMSLVGKVNFFIILLLIEIKKILVSVFPISPNIYINYSFNFLFILYIFEKFVSKISFSLSSISLLLIALLLNSSRHVVG